MQHVVDAAVAAAEGRDGGHGGTGRHSHTQPIQTVNENRLGEPIRGRGAALQHSPFNAVWCAPCARDIHDSATVLRGQSQRQTAGSSAAPKDRGQPPHYHRGQGSGKTANSAAGEGGTSARDTSVAVASLQFKQSCGCGGSSRQQPPRSRRQAVSSLAHHGDLRIGSCQLCGAACRSYQGTQQQDPRLQHQ